MEDTLDIAQFPERRLTPREAGKILGYAPGTMKNMRLRGEGPPYYTEERESGYTKIWYKQADVMVYLEATIGRRVDPSAQRNAEAAYQRKKAS